ncbi:MAG: hypothetical protein ACFFDN_14685, partial [Candidatus Hodarchaeota archaeon]
NGWFGTTGIITKLSLQLFPKLPFKDVLIYASTKIDDFVDAMHEVSMYEICEDLLGMYMGLMGKTILLAMVFSGHSQEELDFKRKILINVLDEFKSKPNPETGKKRRISLMKGLPQNIIDSLLIVPPPEIARTMGDVRKGGGAEYLGSYIPFESIKEVFEGGREISKKYGLAEATYIIRAISLNHSIMFALNYPYNRKIEEERKIVEEQLKETTELILRVGGYPGNPM